MKFIFRDYEFENGRATFHYGFDGGQDFTEVIDFQTENQEYDKALLDKALCLAFIIAGVSYWKTFGDGDIELPFALDEFQAKFFNAVYQEGMSQFAYENSLTRDDLAHFNVTSDDNRGALSYSGSGILALQSGGKDSLLTASVLKRQSIKFTPLFMASGDRYPKVLDELGDLVVIRRHLDNQNLAIAEQNGARNGHVPITYIIQSLALVQAILLNKEQILVSIGHEGAEPHAHIGDLAVNHQWSKTQEAEQLFAKYVRGYITPNIKIGSPIRKYSELKIAELFVKNAWTDFGHKFSSCNVANYRQNADNSALKWCGDCPKCANSYLLFAPFVDPIELKQLFTGEDLFDKKNLEQSFKGLLGVDGVMKPFECVGEVDELRKAYQMAQEKGGYSQLPFDVPKSDFNYQKEYDYNPEIAYSTTASGM